MGEIILILTNGDDAHADAMVQMLGSRAVELVRFDPVNFPERAVISVGWEGSQWSYFLTSSHKSIDLSQVKSIWLRRPTKWKADYIDDEGIGGFIGAERDQAIEALWQSLDVFWVNNPATSKLASLKLHQLAIASKVGFRIPKTLISNDPSEVMRFFKECKGNIIYKTLSATDDTYLDLSVYTSPVSSMHIENIDKVASAPCLFQENVPKHFEVRATVLGDQIFSAAIFSQEFEETKHDWRKGYDLPVRFEQYCLPYEIELLAFQLVSELKLAYGAIDMVVTPEGEHIFLEINPHGQFGFIEHETGLPIFSALADLLIKGGV